MHAAFYLVEDLPPELMSLCRLLLLEPKGGIASQQPSQWISVPGDVHEEDPERWDGLS